MNTFRRAECTFSGPSDCGRKCWYLRSASDSALWSRLLILRYHRPCKRAPRLCGLHQLLLSSVAALDRLQASAVRLDHCIDEYERRTQEDRSSGCSSQTARERQTQKVSCGRCARCHDRFKSVNIGNHFLRVLLCRQRDVKSRL